MCIFDFTIVFFNPLHRVLLPKNVLEPFQIFNSIHKIINSIVFEKFGCLLLYQSHGFKTLRLDRCQKYFFERKWSGCGASVHCSHRKHLARFVISEKNDRTEKTNIKSDSKRCLCMDFSRESTLGFSNKVKHTVNVSYFLVIINFIF